MSRRLSRRQIDSRLRNPDLPEAERALLLLDRTRHLDLGGQPLAEYLSDTMGVSVDHACTLLANLLERGLVERG